MNQLITKLVTKVYQQYFPYLLAGISIPRYYLRNHRQGELEAVVKGFSDHSSLETRCPKETLSRLLFAYNLAKKDQVSVNRLYKPGAYWQWLLDSRFELPAQVTTGDRLNEVRMMLENFNRLSCSYDACGGGYFYDRMKHIPGYKYQFANNWENRLHALLDYLPDPPNFDLPSIGNPVGVWYHNQTIPLCSLEYYCYATEIYHLLADSNSPTICEIGGGVGGQAYEIIRKGIPGLVYIILDIPEVLLLSSYYLMVAFPDKQFQLYGETYTGQEIRLLPNFTLPSLSAESVDLFFNSCSFSEMDYFTVVEYLTQIERIGSKYLMHINHNAKLVWWEGGKKTTNMTSDLVQPKNYKLVYKEPRKFTLFEDTFVINWFFKAKYYKYLYGKDQC